ncbi:carboxymuconolactone decarboxylase family protein [Halioxenophilus aromaticivorans]|uniref:Carboxymuconolactone decarboxylase family protein n=2 Tax=Halioxenophilus aromaticivorans TaxID=1306992 RepID=A0AAV3U5V4_9ALTE
MSFTFYEIETAPENVKPQLEASKKAFGFVPGLHKALAASPQVLEIYKHLHTEFQNSSFNNAELTVVWQTINYYHHCNYCLPAHTGIAHMMQVDEKLIDALSKGEPVADPKLRALQETTYAIVDQRGNLTDAQLDKFYSAGYGNQQLLEILLGLAQKVLSNYTNHLAKTPVDEAFKKFVV